MIELKARPTALALLLGMVSCSSHRADPFGKLSKEQLASWTSDCPSKVTDTPIRRDAHDADAVTVGDRLAFSTATHRLQCDAAGWSLWLDASERVAGVCTQGYVDISVTPSRIQTPQQRGEPVLRRHFPASVVDEMVAGYCVSHPHENAKRLLRWEYKLPQRGEHSTVACCWEVSK